MTAQRIAIALAFVGVVGCKKQQAPLPPAPAPMVAEAPLPQQNVFTATASVAAFAENKLVECVDISATAVDHEPDGGIDNVVTKVFDLFTESMKSRKWRTVELKVSCPEQFPDRAAIANCVIDKSSQSDDRRLLFTENYYDPITVFEDDGLMMECLEVGGRWSAIPKNSGEATRARMHRTAEDAVSHMKRLSDQMERQ